jgi:hypothetical protein
MDKRPAVVVVVLVIALSFSVANLAFAGSDSAASLRPGVPSHWCQGSLGFDSQGRLLAPHQPGMMNSAACPMGNSMHARMHAAQTATPKPAWPHMRLPANPLPPGCPWHASGA